MNTVWIFCRVTEDGCATQFISAHATREQARSAERVFRQVNNLHSLDRTNTFEVEFSS